MSSHEGAQSVRDTFDHAAALPRKASLADMDECRLYFIAGGGLIKIGISTNVQARFRAIRNSSPVPVELIAVTRGNTHCEGVAHREFAHLRRHGEWFEDCQEIRDFIAQRLRDWRFDPQSDYSWKAAIEADKRRTLRRRSVPVYSAPPNMPRRFDQHPRQCHHLGIVEEYHHTA